MALNTARLAFGQRNRWIYLRFFQMGRFTAKTAWPLKNVEHMEVFWNRGTLKSSILIGFSTINHYKPSILGYHHDYGNPPMWKCWFQLVRQAKMDQMHQSFKQWDSETCCHRPPITTETTGKSASNPIVQGCSTLKVGSSGDSPWETSDAPVQPRTAKGLKDDWVEHRSVNAQPLHLAPTSSKSGNYHLQLSSMIQIGKGENHVTQSQLARDAFEANNKAPGWTTSSTTNGRPRNSLLNPEIA